MSISKPPTVKAWQHVTDPDRVLLAWPGGKAMVVNSGGFIEDTAGLESPDSWRPLGKPVPGGAVRGPMGES